MINFNNIEFIKSAADSDGFLRDGLPQIVFSGRSNVGKSSVINKLLGRKSIAKVASRPGKTIHINYFLIDKKAYFVDLPGYGYAKVAKSEKARWEKLMNSYFSGGDHITLGIMIVDARHKPTELDIIMSEWFEATGCSYVIAANKIDKVKNSQKDVNLALIHTTLGLDDNTRIIPFSAISGVNKAELLSEITKVL
jgi:GTP-binding protein